MFFSKSFVATAILAASLSLEASAQAIITPALGLSGTSQSDAQQPSTASPCGSVDISSVFDSAQAITASDDVFSATITNFDAGTAGSRQVTCKVDPTGTGNSFVDATVTQNGDQDPTAAGSQQLKIQLPSGTTCTGGTAGDKCLVAFTTDGGYGNCVVVQQPAAATTTTPKAANPSPTTGAGNTNNNTPTNGNGNTNTNTNTNTNGSPAAGNAARGQQGGPAHKREPQRNRGGANRAAANNNAPAPARATPTPTPPPPANQNQNQPPANQNQPAQQAAAGGNRAAAAANRAPARPRDSKPFARFVEEQRLAARGLGTRAAAVARRAAEGPAVEVL